MKLVSMKIDRAERAEKSEATMSADAPAYPYGLEVRLDRDALEKLGLADNLPAAGQVMKLSAVVDVTSVSESDSAGGGKTCAVSLQITDMALAATKREDAGDTLYDGGKKK